jgi:hypothetical protein
MEESKKHDDDETTYPTSLTLEEIMEVTAEIRF